jgi:hypothetical protein
MVFYSAWLHPIRWYFTGKPEFVVGNTGVCDIDPGHSSAGDAEIGK